MSPWDNLWQGVAAYARSRPLHNNNNSLTTTSQSLHKNCRQVRPLRPVTHHAQQAQVPEIEWYVVGCAAIALAGTAPAGGIGFLAWEVAVGTWKKRHTSWAHLAHNVWSTYMTSCDLCVYVPSSMKKKLGIIGTTNGQHYAAAVGESEWTECGCARAACCGLADGLALIHVATCRCACR